MVYLDINKNNNNNVNKNFIDKLNKLFNHNDAKIFILFFMEGCGPCNATRPEWSKLNNVLSNEFKNRNDIVIVSIDKDFANKLKNFESELNSFPTIKFINNSGKINENYEDSNISTKDRSIDSFIEWIKDKTGEKNITKTEKKNYKGGKTKKKRWTLKHKNSINCNRPKGFSQKQYCKYSRKKHFTRKYF
jgi:thiol-disulfide isomerase/thioredoxin